MSQEQIDSPALSEGKIIGDAFGVCFEALKGLSYNERFQVLKSLGGAFGHRLVPGTGLNQLTVPGVSPVGTVPKAPTPQKSKKSAERIALDKKVRELNSRIKTASSEVGGRLASDHPLLEERARLFRALRGKADNLFGPETGQSSKNP